MLQRIWENLPNLTDLPHSAIYGQIGYIVHLNQPANRLDFNFYFATIEDLRMKEKRKPVKEERRKGGEKERKVKGKCKKYRRKGRNEEKKS